VVAARFRVVFGSGFLLILIELQESMIHRRSKVLNDIEVTHIINGLKLRLSACLEKCMLDLEESFNQGDGQEQSNNNESERRFKAWVPTPRGLFNLNHISDLFSDKKDGNREGLVEKWVSNRSEADSFFKKIWHLFSYYRVVITLTEKPEQGELQQDRLELAERIECGFSACSQIRGDSIVSITTWGTLILLVITLLIPDPLVWLYVIIIFMALTLVVYSIHNFSKGNLIMYVVVPTLSVSWRILITALSGSVFSVLFYLILLTSDGNWELFMRSAFLVAFFGITAVTLFAEEKSKVAENRPEEEKLFKNDWKKIQRYKKTIFKKIRNIFKIKNIFIDRESRVDGVDASFVLKRDGEIAITLKSPSGLSDDDCKSTVGHVYTKICHILKLHINRFHPYNDDNILMPQRIVSDDDESWKEEFIENMYKNIDIELLSDDHLDQISAKGTVEYISVFWRLFGDGKRQPPGPPNSFQALYDSGGRNWMDYERRILETRNDYARHCDDREKLKLEKIENNLERQRNILLAMASLFFSALVLFELYTNQDYIYPGLDFITNRILTFVENSSLFLLAAESVLLVAIGPWMFVVFLAILKSGWRYLNGLARIIMMERFGVNRVDWLPIAKKYRKTRVFFAKFSLKIIFWTWFTLTFIFASFALFMTKSAFFQNYLNLNSNGVSVDRRVDNVGGDDQISSMSLAFLKDIDLKLRKVLHIESEDKINHLRNVSKEERKKWTIFTYEIAPTKNDSFAFNGIWKSSLRDQSKNNENGSVKYTNLDVIEGSLDISGSKNLQFESLTEIKGDLIMNDAENTSLPRLTKVDGNVYMRNVGEKENTDEHVAVEPLKELKEVGGSLDISDSKNLRFQSLIKVGGELICDDAKASSFPKMTGTLPTLGSRYIEYND